MSYVVRPKRPWDPELLSGCVNSASFWWQERHADEYTWRPLVSLLPQEVNRSRRPHPLLMAETYNNAWHYGGDEYLDPQACP